MGPFTALLAHAMLYLTLCSVKNIMGPGRRGSDRRSLKVSEARPLIEEAETERLVSSDSVSTGLYVLYVAPSTLQRQGVLLVL